MEHLIKQIENAFVAKDATYKALQLEKRDEVLEEQIFLRERARSANERRQLLDVPIN